MSLQPSSSIGYSVYAPRYTQCNNSNSDPPKGGNQQVNRSETLGLKSHDIRLMMCVDVYSVALWVHPHRPTKRLNQ